MDSLSRTDEKWVFFLRDLKSALSSILLQKRKDETNLSSATTKLVELTSPNYQQVKEIPGALEEFLGLFASDFPHYVYLRFENIRDIQMDATKVKQLNEMLTLMLKTPPIFERPNSKKLLVKGPLITASAVEDYIKQNPELEIVEIFALEKIFIDKDLDTEGQKMQVTIIAPTWEVEKEARIKLDGKTGKGYEQNAGNLDVPGSPGNDGKQGQPGGPAGHFLGIGSTCSGCDRLTVTAIGGPGGAGQDGGAGQKSKDGPQPITPGDYQHCNRNFKKDWTAAGHTWKCTESANKYDWEVFTQTQKCNVIGGGASGGDGGNGGAGGEGGKAGTASLTLQAGATAKVTSTKGPHGKPGAGGKGGPGGKRHLLEVNFDHWGWEVGDGGCSEDNVKRSTDFLPSGKDGKPGQNGETTTSKSKAIPLVNLSYAVTAYKNYLRENLKNPIIGPTLQNFLNYLETEEKIVSLYDTVGLVKDLLSMEHQSRNLLGKGVPLMPFYQQLLNRVENYKLQPHEKDVEEYKMVLSYLYRSALSKINSINSNTSNELVLDVRKNLAFVSANIQEWKDFKNLVEKNKTRNKYKEGIQSKVEEANEFINEEINKDIESNIERTTEQLNKLYEETVKLEQAANNEKAKLEEQKEKLERQLALRSILGVVQIAGQALALAGPVGVAASAVIGGVTSAAENFATGDSTTVAIAALPDAVATTLTKINDAYKKKQEMFKNQLNKANIKLTEFLNADVTAEKTSAKQSLENIHNKITEAKGALETEMKKATIEDPASISRMYDLRKDLNKLIEDQKKEIEHYGKESSKQAAKYAAAVEKIQNIIGLAKMGVDLYSKIQGDISKIDEVDKSIKKANDKLANLDAYEESIYTKIAPLIGRIRKSIESAEKSDGKSHAALDVTKWQVQGSMRDVRREMQKMTKGFEAGDEITYYIDKVEYGMSMMIQMYDRIQSYLDQGNLVDVITNVGSSADASNSELYTAVSELKLQISANIIADYKNTMDAVLQYVFPFATDYMKPLTLPDRFSLDSTDQIADTLKSMEKTLQREATTTQARDAKIIANVTFGHGKKHPPFFVWKHSKNAEAIKKLLQGQKVYLNADISRSDIQDNAVKFNDIGIRFSTNDNGLQDQLNEALEGFSVEMIHLGDSRYRCRNSIYLVSHQEQAIQHSVSKGGNGRYEEGNVIYAKVGSNEPMLSPYATWAIKLGGENNDFSILRDFIGREIDLELEGRGNFVKRDAACTDLRKYYKLQRARGQRRLLNSMDNFAVIIQELADAENAKSSRSKNYTGLAERNYGKHLDFHSPQNIPEEKLAQPVGFSKANSPTTDVTRTYTGSESDMSNVKYNSIGVAANLPLFELMIRKINGSRRQRRSLNPAEGDYGNEFAQNLAYSAYAPK